MRHLMLFCSALTLLTSAAFATETPAPTATPTPVPPPAATATPVAPVLTSAPVAAAPTPAAPTAPAAAPVITALTEDLLNKFYEESKSAYKKPYEEYRTYMNLHTHDDVQVRINMTNHPPGEQPVKDTIILDKRKFLATLADTYKVSQSAKIDHRVTGVYVGKDGKSAQVTDTTTMSYTIPFPGRERSAKIEIQSQSNCEDIVQLNPAGVIQIYESVCDSDMYVFPKQK